MATVVIPDDVLLVTFYDRKENEERTEPGLHISPARGKMGSGLWNIQGIILPLRSCEYLAALDPFAMWQHNMAAHGDRMIEEYMAISPWPRFAVHVPCLVRHIGRESIAHPDFPFSLRHTRNYAGDDFDAMTLAFGNEKEL
jgi:hypothetical protein